MTDFDPVEKPKHYNTHPSGVETITVTRQMGFDLGNAVKYVWRAPSKNGEEDLRKARFYLRDYMHNHNAASAMLPAHELRRVGQAETQSARRQFFMSMADGKLGDAFNAVEEMIEAEQAKAKQTIPQGAASEVGPIVAVLRAIRTQK